MFLGHDREGRAAYWLRRARVFFLVLVILPRLALAAEATPDGEPASGAKNGDSLFLSVLVNGRLLDKIGEFTVHDGKLMARPEELRELGFRVPMSVAPKFGGLIALHDLPGLKWSIDFKNQMLLVTARDIALLPTVLRPEGRERSEVQRVIESGTGVTLNDDIVGTFSSGQAGASGSLDLRALSPLGVVSSGLLGYAGATSGTSGKNTAIRLDSTYTFADVNTLRRYSLGDFITSGLAWTRPVHMEGAQIRSDFSMRPDLVTFPLPLITGSVAVPSAVNVLADGNLMITRQIEAGPFEIPQLPVVSGAGTISMTVTDARGQQVNVTQPFYASTDLLDPGLKTFAGEAGLVRRNWGSISNDYGKIAGTAAYRRGMTRKFTIEGSAEGTSGAAMGGAGGVLQVGNLGVVNFAAAASGGSGHTGTQFSAGAQRIGRVFSLGGSAIIATRDFRDIAAMNGDPVQRKQLNANTGISMRHLGSVGVAYGGIDQDSPPHPIQTNVTPALHSKILSANYSFQIRRMSVYATEFRTFSGTGNSGLQVGLTIALGRRASVGASGTSDGNGQLQVQRSAPQVGDWGYQAYVSAGDSFHEFGEVQYKSPVGLFTAGVDQSSGQTTFRVESQGAVSLVDRGLFRSNTIYDSFAIVDTRPIPHVRVLQENRDVGRTNSSGRLLVPDMRSFDLNHIAIEPTDIPPDATLNDASREMRPQDRSGVVVKFPIKFSHAALLRLIDDAGVPMPLGSTATLLATRAIVPIGYDGEAYLEDLSPHNELTVERPNGQHCTVVFDYRAVFGDIPSLGPLRCLEKRP